MPSMPESIVLGLFNPSTAAKEKHEEALKKLIINKDMILFLMGKASRSFLPVSP